MASCKKCRIHLSADRVNKIAENNKISLIELRKRHVKLLCRVCGEIENSKREKGV